MLGIIWFSSIFRQMEKWCHLFCGSIPNFLNILPMTVNLYHLPDSSLLLIYACHLTIVSFSVLYITQRAGILIRYLFYSVIELFFSLVYSSISISTPVKYSSKNNIIYDDRRIFVYSWFDICRMARYTMRCFNSVLLASLHWWVSEYHMIH